MSPPDAKSPQRFGPETWSEIAGQIWSLWDVATESTDRYSSAAERLGSRWWRPIIAMASSLLEAGDRNGAVEVFRSADQPGSHQEHLRRTCAAMVGVDLSVAADQGAL